MKVPIFIEVSGVWDINPASFLNQCTLSLVKLNLVDFELNVNKTDALGLEES